MTSCSIQDPAFNRKHSICWIQLVVDEARLVGVTAFRALMQICTVFAQLTVDGKWQGPHVFVVRLRDNNSQLTPGVTILDNGPKMGLNGVDNGQIWFDHVKVPRDALLDKYASVSGEGVYTSSIKSVSQRFGMTVGGLTTGVHAQTTSLLHDQQVVAHLANISVTSYG